MPTQNPNFNKFSPDTQAILLKSQELAEERAHGVIGSEHLLLSMLLLEPHSIATELLTEYLVDRDQIELVLSLDPPLEGRPGRDGITHEARRVLEQSALQAIHARASAIEPTHILWAIVTDDQATAHSVLTKTGVNPDHLRSQIEQLFHDHAHLDHLIEQHLELLEAGEDTHDHESTSHSAPGGKKRSALETLTTDLTALAKEGELDPLIGRADELERLVHILLRRTKNNPILIGEPGVGKTSIVEGLAARIVTGDVPEALRSMRLRRLEVATLVAGTMYRGQFEDRLRKLLLEIEQQGTTILFVDEVHTIIGAGSAEGSLDAANILKPALAKGKLRLIGATTLDEYQKHVEKDAAFERRFQPLTVREPSTEETVAILQGLVPKLETHHRLTIPQSILPLAVQLATRYLPNRRLPDKAIDVIDEAAASVQLKLPTVSSVVPPTESRGTLDVELRRITKEKEFEIRRQNFERAAFLRDQELKLKLKLARQRITRARGTSHPTVTEQQIFTTVARMSGVPIAQLASETLAPKQLIARLSRTVVGQPSAIERVARTIARSQAGLHPAHQPQSALLFVGPSGVGKTSLAYAVAETMFGSTDAVIRLDMSEFREPHTVSRLVGAPPGYVGHDDGGKLTEQLRQRPASVVLFDEIEKAHPDVFNLLLQILDYGTLTDSKGRAVSFRNAHIVLTTNAGSEAWKGAALGFGTQANQATRAREAATSLLRTELLNRLDDIIVFEPLSADTLSALIERRVLAVNAHLLRHSLAVDVHPAAQRELVRLASESNLGARELLRLVAQHIENPAIDLLVRPNRRAHRAQLIHRDGELILQRGTASSRKAAVIGAHA